MPCPSSETSKAGFQALPYPPARAWAKAPSKKPLALKLRPPLLDITDLIDLHGSRVVNAVGLERRAPLMMHERIPTDPVFPPCIDRSSAPIIIIEIPGKELFIQFPNFRPRSGMDREAKPDQAHDRMPLVLMLREAPSGIVV